MNELLFAKLIHSGTFMGNLNLYDWCIDFLIRFEKNAKICKYINFFQICLNKNLSDSNPSCTFVSFETLGEYIVAWKEFWSKVPMCGGNDFMKNAILNLLTFKDNLPARAAFQVAALPKNGLVEIEAVAVIGVNTAGSIYEMKSQFWRTEVRNETLTSFIIESIDSKKTLLLRNKIPLLNLTYKSKQYL